MNLGIHLSTAQLCIASGVLPEVDRHGVSFGRAQHVVDLPMNTEPARVFASADSELADLHVLSLTQYYGVCSTVLEAAPYHAYQSVFGPATTYVGGVICWVDSEHPVQKNLAFVPDMPIWIRSWGVLQDRAATTMPDASTRQCRRFNSIEALNRTFQLLIYCGTESWLSQANHAFDRQEIIDKLKINYALVTCVQFQIDVSYAKHAPLGYLFLAPWTDFQTGPTSFRWPDSAAYWSLDPLGIDRLSTDEATHLGFPHIQQHTTLKYQCWDVSFYAGLRQFHAGKGFDPDSQDVARHLGYPMYPPFSEMDAPFAHFEEPESPDSFEPPVSRGFKILINVQLALIFFSMLYQVCETVACLHNCASGPSM
ncbi:hypothetical protein C8R46DRAFT_1139728 [Mycena filopes]|nr:hypothetical protein C8R46DRAFT_1139728 [Mycena filopes]